MTDTEPDLTSPGDPGEDQPGRLRRLSRNPLVWAGAGVLVVVLGVALALTQPWKLFIDQVVDEDFPVVAAGVEADPPADDSDGQPADEADSDEPADGATDEADPAPTTEAPPEIVELSRGEFSDFDKQAAGTALLVELANGERFLRIEDLNTVNGPDLLVFLSAAEANSSNAAVDTEPYVDLGPLKGNIGNQNYEIPPDVNLSEYNSVVIWCRRFTSAFGFAPIELSL